MPLRSRPEATERSEHWLRVAVNDHPNAFNGKIRNIFGWSAGDEIKWLSPIRPRGYAEYYDQSFLDLLELKELKVPLCQFWPPSGPRWDGLAKTDSGKLLLVEAKAYIEEGVDYKSRAVNHASIELIRKSLQAAKVAYGAAQDANWETPFYQYANRLAHLYFLRDLNGVDAHLLFVYFADAPDVPRPCSVEQWAGARRLAQKCLGLGDHPFRSYVGDLTWSVSEMLETKCKSCSAS